MANALPETRLCRNEFFICTHIYARTGILAQVLPTFLIIAVEPFPLFAGSLPAMRRPTAAADEANAAHRMSTSAPCLQRSRWAAWPGPKGWAVGGVVGGVDVNCHSRHSYVSATVYLWRWNSNSGRTQAESGSGAYSNAIIPARPSISTRDSDVIPGTRPVIASDGVRKSWKCSS
jgi:hypothetical protein